MDIQKYIFNNIGIFLPISEGNGQSQDKAIVIGSETKYMLISVEDKLISTMLSDGYWKKVKLSLINIDCKKYDKITIQHFLVDGDVEQRVFWFDVNECF